jgi:succinoglycan biosynthesis transport protein ExoP
MIHRILALWGRRKWIALLTFAVPMCVVGGLVSSLPNIYRSTAMVLIERQQVPEAFVRPTVTGEVETRLQSISQEIFSRSSLEALIARFNLYPRLRDRLSAEALVGRMRNDIILVMKSDPAAAGPKMVAFTVSYRGADPVTVADVTNTLAVLFIEENLKIRSRQSTGTAEFLRSQLEETTRQLDEQERRVSEYSRRYMGELPQQMTSNLTAIEQLSTQLRLNNDRQTLAQARREALERQLADVETLPLAPASGGAGETPAIRLMRLRLALRELRAQYTDKYPEVVRLRREVATLERELGDKAPVEAVGGPALGAQDPAGRRIRSALTEMDAELKALRKDEQRLQAAIARYQARLDNTPQREQEFQEISRNYLTTKEHYQSLLKRYQEAQLAEDMEQRRKGEQFKIVDPAMASERPAAPNRPRFLLTGLLLSVGLAVAAVILIEHLDTSFHSVDELRAFTRAPVLVSIARITAVADVVRRRRRWRLTGAVAVFALVALAVGSHLAGRGNATFVSLLSPGGS